jgi:type VI secretion system protein ImpA
MSDTETPADVAEPVASWLMPLDGSPCGDDLEYDPAVLELNQTAAGKPETQFSAAEPPPWPLVREQAEMVMARTRDLRIAALWGRSMLNTQGLPGLLPTLQLHRGLLDNFWDQGLHPALDPDDGDPFARVSAIGGLDKLDGLLGDVRASLALMDRRLGGLRVRDIEVALDRLPPRADETPRTARELSAMFEDLPDAALALRTLTGHCLLELKQLQRVMNDRFGIGEAVDVKNLRLMLEAVKSTVPEPAADDAAPGDDGGPVAEGAAAPAARGGGTLSRIDTRKDAIRAINLICEYLERSEPTNPAQLLLRRAERLIEKNFLQLVRELAPEAMAEVARIMGVDPDSIGNDP